MACNEIPPFVWWIWALIRVVIVSHWMSEVQGLNQCSYSNGTTDAFKHVSFDINTKGGLKCEAVLKRGTVILFTSVAGFNSEMDLVLVNVKNPEARSLQIGVNNGLDNVVFALPSITSNGTLINEGSRILRPLRERDVDPPGQITILLQSNDEPEQRVELRISKIDRGQFLVRLDAKKKSSTLRIKDLSPTRPVAQWIEFPDSAAMKMMIQSNDEVCASFSSTSFANNKESLRQDGVPDFRFTFTDSAVFVPDPQQYRSPLFVTFTVPDDDSICGTTWRSPKAREKWLEVEYTLTEAPDFVLPLSLLCGIFILPWVAAASVSICRFQRSIGHEALELSAQESVESVSNHAQHETDDLIFFVDRQTANGTGSSDVRRRGDPYAVANEEIIGNVGDSGPAYILPAGGNESEKERPTRFSMKYIQFALFLLPVVFQEGLLYIRNSSIDDTCYHNFACAIHWGSIHSFNRVASNVGYFSCGVLYFLLVYLRHNGKWTHHEPESQVPAGVYRNALLEYGTAMCMICESLASAVYHLCPSSHSFRLDTPFILMACALIVLKLYGSRHGEITCTQMHGVLWLTLASHFAIAELSRYPLGETIAAISVLSLFLLALLKIYNGKHFLKGRQLFQRLRLSFRGRILVAVFVLNCVGTGVYLFSGRAVHINEAVLFFMVFNMTVYFLYYLLNKVHHKEKLSPASVISLALSFVLWTLAFFAYVHRETDWRLSPSKSRSLNTDCVLLNFYDWHDIWHIVSALAALASLFVVTAIDDRTSLIPRNRLVVF